MTDQKFFSHALKELVLGLVFLAVIVFVGMNVFSFFKGGGKEPPKSAKAITMPPTKAHAQDGAPMYDSTIAVDIPFAKSQNNFIFAEIVTDAVYQATVQNEIWVRLRTGNHYPSFGLPVDASVRQLSLDRSFVVPIHELGAVNKSKYWMRFGMVEFLTHTKTYRDGVSEATGRHVDELGGYLFLPFRETGNVTVFPRGEWTTFAPFYVEAK